MRNVLRTFIAIILVFGSMSGPALAYIGPGAGLSAIGTLFALVGAVALAIVGFLWYPMKRLFRALRRPKPSDGPSDGSDGGTK